MAAASSFIAAVDRIVMTYSPCLYGSLKKHQDKNKYGRIIMVRLRDQLWYKDRVAWSSMGADPVACDIPVV